MRRHHHGSERPPAWTWEPMPHVAARATDLASCCARIFGEVTGETVLAFGPHAGACARVLHESGANIVRVDGTHRHARTDPPPGPGTALPRWPEAGFRLPYPDEFFDHVVSQHGVVAGTNPLAAIGELGRVLRRGGLFVFTLTSWVVADGAALDATRTAVDLRGSAWATALERNGLRLENLVQLKFSMVKLPGHKAGLTTRVTEPIWAARKSPHGFDQLGVGPGPLSRRPATLPGSAGDSG